MKTLIISSYPPRHCGIGAYASAQAEQLRAAGDDVVVLSPLDGDGDLRRAFIGGQAFRYAASIGAKFDRIFVHFQPGLYFRPRSPVTHVVTAASLLYLVRRRSNVEIVVHEAAEPPSRFRPDYALLGRAFSRARLTFHTQTERAALERAYRVSTTSRVVPHTSGVTVHASMSRGRARELLGLPGEGTLFLCAGFLQPDKGFDRAIRAFSDAGSPGHLYVVGSIRMMDEAVGRYVDDLRALARATQGVTLVEDYVTDDDFDAWVAAADWLVLPYRKAWSSGALARAQQLGTPALISDSGGLAEQATTNDVVFGSDEVLTDLFARSVRADAS